MLRHAMAPLAEAVEVEDRRVPAAHDQQRGGPYGGEPRAGQVGAAAVSAVARAVRRASKAQEQWAATSDEERGGFLRRAADGDDRKRLAA